MRANLKRGVGWVGGWVGYGGFVFAREPVFDVPPHDIGLACARIADKKDLIMVLVLRGIWKAGPYAMRRVGMGGGGGGSLP